MLDGEGFGFELFWLVVVLVYFALGFVWLALGLAWLTLMLVLDWFRWYGVGFNWR